MTDAPQPQEPTAAQPATGAPLPKDVEEGRTFAILSYALSFISIPFFLVPLIMRNNEFSLYHAKQCLMIWLAGIVVGMVGSLLMVVCVGVILLPAGMIFLLVLAVMGLINAVKGEQKPIPVIGKYAEDWFKGISKV
ncbi:MAG: Chloroplast import component protein (Tic20) [Verrucomicrobia bacterium ADurb.Bin345]|nr:MAG: Chloroplast import component protein (Tic20) [Verrucomicrobia bacterium ADurb.Bin345]